VLAVVEHEQELLVRQRTRQQRSGIGTALLAHTQHRGDHRGHLCIDRECSEVHPPHAVREQRAGARGRDCRQSGLSDAAYPRQCDHPAGSEEVNETFELFIATDQRPPNRRWISHDDLTPQRWEVADESLHNDSEGTFDVRQTLQTHHAEKSK